MVLADRIVASPGEEVKAVSNVLPWEKRIRVLAALLDGNSERAVERMTDVNRETIGRLALTLGAGATRLQDRLARDLRTPLIQVDEIWAYVGKKDARVTPADAPGIGEAYTFTAMDALSRFVICWHVGRRDQASADAFITDLRARVVMMPQITSDGFAPYITSIGASFGTSVDYMQTVKNYRTGARRGPDHRYEPARDPFITKSTVYGVPDPKRASTAYMERQNATARHMIGRMRRLCYAFSKRPENHRAAVALSYVGYNLTRVVRTLRVTPAMQANVTDHVWSVEELLDALLSEPAGEKPRAKPLEHREPAGPARSLPNGRGFLRLVTEPTPARKGATPRHDPPSAPVAVPPPADPPAKPSRPVQLSLFPEPTDPKV